MGLETAFRFLAFLSEISCCSSVRQEGRRAGEEPFLQGHQHEVGGELLGMVVARWPAAARRTACSAAWISFSSAG